MFWGRRGRNAFMTPSEVVSAYDEGVDALLDPARYIAGFDSGLDAVDRLAGGLRRGTLTLLSGEAGAGKTALALAFARNAALVHRVPTAIFSPAVTSEHLLLRLLSAEARIPLGQFTKHGLDAAQKEAAHEAWERVSRSPLFINDRVTGDLRKLRRSLHRLVQRSEIHFVVVDSVGVDRPRGWFRRSAGAAELLAGVAREFHVAVLGLGGPAAADDRSTWEQHVDRIMDLRLTSCANQAEVLVQRNRFGSTGRAALRFNPGCLAFENAGGQ
jgi:replicative DNA helicase